jgi:hypothetical protein
MTMATTEQDQATHRTCDHCGKRPAEWTYCPGCDAPLLVACTPCVIERYGEVPTWAEPYTPQDNERADRWREWLAQSWAREEP